jgi:hypothetical protein
MTDGRRRAWIGVPLVAVAAFFAWLMWPRPPEPPRNALICALEMGRIAVETKPHAERRRDVADPPTSGDVSPEMPVPVAQKPTAEPTFPFDVTVLRADGTPAAGATVLLLDEGDDGDWAHELVRTKTDEKGVAATRPTEATVRVAAWLGAEATATGELIAVKDRRAVTLRLSPAVVVRGRVLRGESAEAGADVELSASPWFGSDFGLTMKAKSDAEGRFESPPIAVAGVDRLNPPYVHATTKDMARGYAETEIDQLDAELVVRLVSGFTARARFVDADGKPVAVELRAAGSRSYGAKSDADGRVELRLPAGKYEFVALHETDRSYIADFDVEVACSPFIADPIVGNWKTAHAVGAATDGSRDVDFGDVLFARGKPVTGLVVDPGGKPVARASASLSLREVRVGSVVTDAEGRFTFPEVGDEPHRVYVRETLADPTSTGARRATVENVRGGDPELRVVVGDNFAVFIRFLAEGDRTPVTAPDVKLRAFRHGETASCAGISSVGDPMSDAAIVVPAAGSYDVEVTVAGYEPQRFESVEVVAGRPTSLDLLLRKKHE